VSDAAVLWDFDGTLARREGMWAGCLLEVLDEQDAGHAVRLDDLRPALASGFPWHDPSQPHPELNDPGAWWDRLGNVFARAYRSVGYAPDDAAALAGHVRARFLRPDRWSLFDDAVPALTELRSNGWANVIVSNHVPELPQLVADLGLASAVDDVVTSAAVSYDKPHPGIFEAALDIAGRPEQVWMVGDNPVADVDGAEQVGIPAILVRRDAATTRRADDLHGAVAIILDERGLGLDAASPRA
jgi:putative hydrolase of the HAD superfamily